MSLTRVMQAERGLADLPPAAMSRLHSDFDVESVPTKGAQGALCGEGYVTAIPGEQIAIARRADRDVAKLPLLDLFCGVGGFSAGFEATGRFEVAAGIDLLGDRLQTFSTNHPAANAYGQDIRGIKISSLERDNPRPFVIVGGPPCQGFSSIRPFRNIDWNDPRNNLVEEFCRIVDKLEPEWIVFENVVGLLTHGGGRAHRAVVEAFQALGYRTSARVMNGAFHGLPQRRERLIVVGSRKGKAFAWPEPTHLCDSRSMAGDTKLLLSPEVGMFSGGLAPAVTVMDAIGDLPPVDAGGKVRAYAVSGHTHEYQRMIRNGCKTLELHEATGHRPEMMKIIRHAGSNISSLPSGMVTSGFSSCYSRLDPDEPSVTLTVNFVHPSSNKCIHPFQDRALTPREGARLQGFQDTFQFRGTRSQIVKQIGNAVPPLLGRCIADAIIRSD